MFHGKVKQTEPKKIYHIPSNTSVLCRCILICKCNCGWKGCLLSAHLLPKVLNVVNIYVQTFAILLYIMPNEMPWKNRVCFLYFDASSSVVSASGWRSWIIFIERSMTIKKRTALDLNAFWSMSLFDWITIDEILTSTWTIPFENGRPPKTKEKLASFVEMRCIYPQRKTIALPFWWISLSFMASCNN